MITVQLKDSIKEGALCSSCQFPTGTVWRVWIGDERGGIKWWLCDDCARELAGLLPPPIQRGHIVTESEILSTSSSK